MKQKSLPQVIQEMHFVFVTSIALCYWCTDSRNSVLGMFLSPDDKDAKPSEVAERRAILTAFQEVAKGSGKHNSI
jgi:hypothetical protein